MLFLLKVHAITILKIRFHLWGACIHYRDITLIKKNSNNKNQIEQKNIT